jgi:hypothetical protein
LFADPDVAVLDARSTACVLLPCEVLDVVEVLAGRWPALLPLEDPPLARDVAWLPPELDEEWLPPELDEEWLPPALEDEWPPLELEDEWPPLELEEWPPLELLEL